MMMQPVPFPGLQLSHAPPSSHISNNNSACSTGGGRILIDLLSLINCKHQRYLADQTRCLKAGLGGGGETGEDTAAATRAGGGGSPKTYDAFVGAKAALYLQAMFRRTTQAALPAAAAVAGAAPSTSASCLLGTPVQALMRLTQSSRFRANSHSESAGGGCRYLHCDGSSRAKAIM